ncbi:flavin reductase [Mycobacterium sp. MS1601]|uniref:flavin reductase family protein n=1 Tax=Mycobacterium sp. MS1601 TaxID=1936029 RepID=UPI0009796579|nr:flavin reductase family protein [Mycobacterium sp. MS1601]AQA01143.1 flavin reductase [Mycobacterium sp. MS1601]
MTSEPQQTRSIFGQFASGVTVITCANDEGTPHGATVTAFTPVSVEPRLCQVTLHRSSRACALLSGAPFTVNILADDQGDIAMNFAGRPCNPGPVWRQGPTAPMICGSVAMISCRPWAEYDGGDHVIFIGEIVAAEVTDKRPLLYFRSTFHELGIPESHVPWSGSFDDPFCGWFGADAEFTPLYLNKTRQGAVT